MSKLDIYIKEKLKTLILKYGCRGNSVRLWLVLVILSILATSLTSNIGLAETYTKVFLYDFNGDGSLDIISSYGVTRLVDGSTVLFNRSLDIYRFKCDSINNCLLIVDGRSGFIHSPGRREAEIFITYPITISNYPYSILSFENKVYWNKRLYSSELEPIGAIYGLFYDNTIAMVYIERFSSRLVVDIKGLGVFMLNIPLMGVISGVGYSNGTYYVLLSTNTGSVFIEWNPLTGALRLFPYDLRVTSTLLFDGRGFIVNGEAGVYYIESGRYSFLASGRGVKVTLDGLIIVSSGKKIIVYKPLDRGLSIIREVDLKEDIVDADYYMDILSYATISGIFYIRFTPLRTITLSIPDTVIAGSDVRISIIGNFTRAFLNLPGLGIITLTKSNASITWRPTIVGSYIVSALVDVEGETIYVSRFINVNPRPAILELRVPSERVKPYSTITITPELYDGLTRAKLTSITGLCTLHVSGVEYPARLWLPITVQAKPIGLEVPVRAICSLPSPYFNVESYKVLRVNETYVSLDFIYIGGGNIYVHAINIYTRESISGVLRASIGGESITVPIPGYIRVKPGSWSISFEFESNGVVLARGSQTIVYYSSIDEAPERAPIVVADRPVTVTTREVITETALLTALAPVRIIETLPVAAAFIAGLTLALVPLIVLIIRGRGGGV